LRWIVAGNLGWQLEMTDRTDFQQAETLRQPKRRISRLALASLILSLHVIPVLYLSFRRVEALHQRTLYACIVIVEKPVYTILHNLCAIAPAVSVILGILALLRINRNRVRLRGTIPAAAAIIISLASLAIYWLSLTHLSEHVH
jgi:hypothetical protein